MNVIQKQAFFKITSRIKATFDSFKEKSKIERVFTSRQNPRITMVGNHELLNFCSNNYLGLSSHPAVIKNAIEATSSKGTSLSTSRFDGGTQDIHKELEKAISDFHNREDAIVYTSWLESTHSVFETLFDANDAILYDIHSNPILIHTLKQSHAINVPYAHLDMRNLEEKLQLCRKKYDRLLIVTDGAFSMDASITPLCDIVDLAQKYHALTFLDDSQGIGVLGENGRGTEDHFNIIGKVDIINGSLGNALGSTGGYTTSSNEIMEIIRQRSIYYQYATSMPPPVVGGALTAFSLISKDNGFLKNLITNIDLFKTKMNKQGFCILGTCHPICPIVMPDLTVGLSVYEELISILISCKFQKKVLSL